MDEKASRFAGNLLILVSINFFLLFLLLLFYFYYYYFINNIKYKRSYVFFFLLYRFLHFYSFTFSFDRFFPFCDYYAEQIVN